MLKLKKFNFSVNEIHEMTMPQINGFYTAIFKEESSEFKMNISANLLGSRGTQEDINTVLKKD